MSTLFNGRNRIRIRQRSANVYLASLLVLIMVKTYGPRACPFCNASVNESKEDCKTIDTDSGDVYHCYCYCCGKEWIE